METRTPDLLITNQLLYQLSYAGECVERLDTRGFPGRQAAFANWSKLVITGHF